MTNEDISVKVAMHEIQFQNMEERIDKLEEAQVQINKIAISVERLASSIEQVCKEQEKQSNRLLKLESIGAEHWNSLTRTIVSCVVSGIVGLVIGAIVKML